MDLLSIGSANQYAKSMARKTQWNLKKQSGDFGGHKKSLRDYVNVTKASSILPQTDEEDNKMSSILTKAQAGKKLSPDEWEYLRTKNPTMYEKLREVEQEQENYEKALKRCKTRDEAQRLHVSKLGEIMSAAKNGDESAIYRLNRLTRTMTEFTKSDEYRKMPTEAEEAIERESERQAKREALREEAEIREAEREARTEENADAVSETETDEESKPVSESHADEENEAVSATNADAESKPVSGTDAEKENKPVFETDANKKPEAGFKMKSDAQAQSVYKGRDAAKAPLQEEIGASVHGRVKPESERVTASAAPFGQRAYLNQMSGKRPRRRAIDAKA